jgi:ribosomal protein S2
MLLMNKYKLRHVDKKRLINFIGLLLYRMRKPGIGFVVNILDNINAVDELFSIGLPCLGIIDSNVPS